MNINKAHCFFEQSGTFKNEFIKLGIPAGDYDILNDFGQTDHVIDLFGEIENAYMGGVSIFDNISQEDLIMAFFPCVRFENQIYMHFQGTVKQVRNYSLKQKMSYDMKLHKELHELYMLISKMVCVCIDKGLRLIIENPYSSEHYLTRYWALKPEWIDHDRRMRGDTMKKPTQYFFVNCKPKHNLIWEPMSDNTCGMRICGKCADGHHLTTVERSMIHPQYANRFIREFVL